MHAMRPNNYLTDNKQTLLNISRRYVINQREKKLATRHTNRDKISRNSGCNIYRNDFQLNYAARWHNRLDNRTDHFQNSDRTFKCYIDNIDTISETNDYT